VDEAGALLVESGELCEWLGAETSADVDAIRRELNDRVTSFTDRLHSTATALQHARYCYQLIDKVHCHSLNLATTHTHTRFTALCPGLPG